MVHYESGIFKRINDYYENTMSDNNRHAIDLIFSTLKEKGVAISDEGFIDTCLLYTSDAADE